MARRKGSKTICAQESYFYFRHHQRMRMSAKTAKVKLVKPGKIDIEKTTNYPQSQLLNKHASGITFNKLSCSYQCFIYPLIILLFFVWFLHFYHNEHENQAW